MSLETAALSSFTPAPARTIERVAPAGHVFEPETVEEMAAIMESATDARAVVVPWGSGRHQGIGHPVEPDVVLSTGQLNSVISHEPEDLTLIVEAGATVGEIEDRLAEHGQTAGLPEFCPEATIGGVVAAGLSAYRRARLGPTRDRMLQVTLVTGDGRLVVGGGTVVKNVSGYDLPRFVAGSLGALGVIASVCLKLWPVAEARSTVSVDDPERAMGLIHRPMAVLSTGDSTRVYLQGPASSVTMQAKRLGGEATEGHRWPDLPNGVVTAALTIPPADLPAAIGLIPLDCDFVAQHGVGRIDLAFPSEDMETLGHLRSWAEAHSGRLTITSAEQQLIERFDPWGVAPPALDLQRRLIANFDPYRIINRGRLAGRL